MQIVADYFPLILFFLAFKWQGIMVATAVAMLRATVTDQRPPPSAVIHPR